MNSLIDIASNSQPPIHWGHFGAVLTAIVLLSGITWMQKPELFSLKKNQNILANDSGVPKYYAYVTPAEDLPQPQVAGASTNQGPSIITDDGQVVPVDMGQVLGASTEGVQLSLDDVKVNAVPESSQAAQKYFSQSQVIENGSVGDANFAAALSSGNQTQINEQAQQLIVVRDALQKLSVPEGLVKLQKIKIIQYGSAIRLLQNFTQADQNPQLVNEDLQQFLKSQQDLDAENSIAAQKYPNEFPGASIYGSLDNDTLSASPAIGINNNLGITNAGQ